MTSASVSIARTFATSGRTGGEPMLSTRWSSSATYRGSRIAESSSAVADPHWARRRWRSMATPRASSSGVAEALRRKRSSSTSRSRTRPSSLPSHRSSSRSASRGSSTSQGRNVRRSLRRPAGRDAGLVHAFGILSRVVRAGRAGSPVGRGRDRGLHDLVTGRPLPDLRHDDVGRAQRSRPQRSGGLRGDRLVGPRPGPQPRDDRLQDGVVAVPRPARPPPRGSARRCGARRGPRPRRRTPRPRYRRRGPRASPRRRRVWSLVASRTGEART